MLRVLYALVPSFYAGTRSQAGRSAGNQQPGGVSEILSGKRRLNNRQVKALGRRFGVSPVVFI